MMSEANKMGTQSQINQLSFEIESWFRTSSTFLKSGLKINFQSLSEISSLQEDLKSYMLSVGLLEIEEKTAVAQVLNPYSGDWIRATQIAMAEIGLKNYFGKSVRSKNIYSGIGSSENRQKYIFSWEFRISERKHNCA